MYQISLDVFIMQQPARVAGSNIGGTAGNETGARRLADISLTLERKILVHLLNYHNMKDDYEVPMAMSQEGIGLTFGVRQSSVSRVLNKMMNERLIEEKSSYVTGSRQKRKIYYLTHEGYQHASEFKKFLDGLVVNLDTGGVAREVPLNKVNEHLEKSIPFIEILNRVNERGVLEISEGARPGDEKSGSLGPVVLGDPMPRPKGFVGRAKELALVSGWMDDGARCIFISGLAGIGKTSLAVGIRDANKDTDVLYVRLRDWSTVTGLVSALAKFLERLGRKGTATYLKKGAGLDLGGVAELLATDLQGLGRAMMFVDDYRTGSENLDAFLSEMLGMLQETSVTLIVLSRSAEGFYDRKQVVDGSVRELKLEGLGKEDCRSLLPKDKVDDATFERIYKMTRGHPLSLELVQVMGDIREIDRFVHEEVLNKLSQDERAVVHLASVFRLPVPAQPLLTVADHEVVDGLVARSLLIDEGGLYEPHDLIREFAYSRLTPAEKERLHGTAFEYHSLRDGTRDVIESIFHLYLSGEREGAVKSLLAKGDLLIGDGLSEDMLKVIESFGSTIPVDLYKDLFRLKERMANIWGEWNNLVEFTYQTALLRKALPPIEEPSMDTRLSFLGRSTEDTGKSLKDIEDSLKVLKDVDDMAGMAHSHIHLAWIHWVRGETAAALGELDKVMAMQDKLEEDEIEVLFRARLLAADICLLSDEIPKAVKHLSACEAMMKMAVAGKDGAQAPVGEDLAGRPYVQLMCALATVASMTSDHNKAEEWCLEALKRCQERMLIRAEAYATLRLSIAFYNAGARDKCERNLEICQAKFARVKDELGLVYCYALTAIVERDKGGREGQALMWAEKAVADVERIGLDLYTGLLHLLKSQILRSQGDDRAAKDAAEKAAALGVRPSKST